MIVKKGDIIIINLFLQNASEKSLKSCIGLHVLDIVFPPPLTCLSVQTLTRQNCAAFPEHVCETLFCSAILIFSPLSISISYRLC